MRPGRIQSGTGTVRLGCGGHATCWLGHPVGVTTISTPTLAAGIGGNCSADGSSTLNALLQVFPLIWAPNTAATAVQGTHGVFGK